MDKNLKIKIVAFFLLVIGFLYLFEYRPTSYTVTVTDKERVTQKSGEEYTSKYLIFCDGENGESLVFENTDTIFHLKFNSSNIYGQLKEEKRYEITVVGVRIPFLSTYQNIIRIKEITHYIAEI